jgi:hypothetical protein
MTVSKHAVKSTIEILTLTLFVVSSYSFYQYIGINEQLRKMTSFVVVFIALVYISPQLFTNYKFGSYAKLFQGLIFLMIMTMVIAFVSWGQSIDQSYRVMCLPLGSLIFFFLLLKRNISIQEIERFVFFYVVVYAVLWFYGLSKAPLNVFPNNEEAMFLDSERGFYRLAFSGISTLVLAIFISINRYIITSQPKWIFFTLAIFVLILFSQTRQLIFFSFLFSLLFLVFKKMKSLIILISIVGVTVLFIPKEALVSKVVDGLVEHSEKEFYNNKYKQENIRITALKYFFLDYSNNVFAVIFGNGFPHARSQMGKRESQMNMRGLYSSDVGYALIYVRIGIVGLLLYFFIFRKALVSKYRSEHLYVFWYLLYLVFANIAASWIMRDGIGLSICCYILYCQSRELYHSNQNEIFYWNSSI